MVTQQCNYLKTIIGKDEHNINKINNLGLKILGYINKNMKVGQEGIGGKF